MKRNLVVLVVVVVSFLFLFTRIQQRDSVAVVIVVAIVVAVQCSFVITGARFMSWLTAAHRQCCGNQYSAVRVNVCLGAFTAVRLVCVYRKIK